ncbi:P-loop containing nucleoside triphosphate hydrolase protein [Mycena capillaripes]|nr:P-loop containing nucleoside triphosphate hydrolase protein [Mycena capillaripes]
MGTLLEIKHIDKVRPSGSEKWDIKSRESNAFTTDSTDIKDEYAAWAQYAFLVQRTVLREEYGYPNVKTTFLIRSDPLRKVLREMIREGPGVNWTGLVVEIDHELLLAFLPRIAEAASNLRNATGISSEDNPEGSTKKKHLTFLIGCLESEYATTLEEVRNLVKHGEITFDLLWAIFVPGEEIFARCKTTGEPRAFLLRKIKREWDHNSSRSVEQWSLTCEYVEAADDPSVAGQQFGLAKHEIKINSFDGVQKIAELVAFPIKHHANPIDIRQKLIHRGQKWMKLFGVHHKHYDGLASTQAFRFVLPNVPYDFNEIGSFASAEPLYTQPTPWKSLSGGFWNVLVDKEHFNPIPEIKDDGHLLLASPILYGFSLTSKRWFEFNIECVTSIDWNAEAFDNLAIDSDRKHLIKGLVKSHANLKEERSADDFVTGKGIGLVFNLFGPPGVGKTLTVEATAEYLQKPLYSVSAGELGTTPTDLAKKLGQIFSFVPVWGAVVLIDEADVFLEKRGTASIERNAIVSIFLRQLEYFQGILFLTSNRVKHFDPAFHSRIHLSLHYKALSMAEKEQLWRGFLEKTRTHGAGFWEPSARELQKLSRRKLNGRQIKNIAKLSLALAVEEKTALTYAHLDRALAMADDWGSARESSWWRRKSIK